MLRKNNLYRAVDSVALGQPELPGKTYQMLLAENIITWQPGVENIPPKIILTVKGWGIWNKITCTDRKRFDLPAQPTSRREYLTLEEKRAYYRSRYYKNKLAVLDYQAAYRERKKTG